MDFHVELMVTKLCQISLHSRTLYVTLFASIVAKYDLDLPIYKGQNVNAFNLEGHGYIWCPSDSLYTGTYLS